MRNDAELLQAVELGGHALNVALVVELTLFEKVGISLLPLASFNCLLLFGCLELNMELAVAVVDHAVRIPEDRVHTLLCCVIEVGELRALACYA